MATRIRLKRIGRKNRPFYRVIVIDSRQRRDGAAIEEIGWYNPIAPDKSNNFELNEERILHWLNLGAQPSEIAQNLIKRAGIAMKWHLMKQGLDEKAIEKEIQKLTLKREAQAKEKLEAAEKETKKKAKESDKKAAAEKEAEKEVKVDKTEEPVEEKAEIKETDEKVEEKPQTDDDKKAEAKEEIVEEKPADSKADEVEEIEVTEEKPAESEPEVEVKEEVTTTKKSTPEEKPKADESAENAESKDEAKDDK